MRKAALAFVLLALFNPLGAHAQLSPSQTVNLGWGIGGVPGIGPGFGTMAGIGSGGTAVGAAVDLEFDAGLGTLTIPARLLPVDRTGRPTGAAAAVGTEFVPRHAAPGTSVATVAACRAAIAKAATRYGAVYVGAASAGTSRRSGRGVVAPIETRVVYARNARQALVNCRLDGGGRVVGLS